MKQIREGKPKEKVLTLPTEAQVVVDLCGKLLEGVANLKDEEHLRKLIDNYVAIKDELDSHMPKVIRMTGHVEGAVDGGEKSGNINE